MMKKHLLLFFVLFMLGILNAQTDFTGLSYGMKHSDVVEILETSGCVLNTEAHYQNAYIGMLDGKEVEIILFSSEELGLYRWVYSVKYEQDQDWFLQKANAIIDFFGNNSYYDMFLDSEVISLGNGKAAYLYEDFGELILEFSEE